MIYVKFNKREFWLDRVVFLRHVISKDIFYIDHKKMKEIVNYLRPTNVTKIHSFIGLTSYYKRFME